MSLAINTNLSSLLAQRTLSKTQESLSSSITRLSTGLKINSANDAAAGLAIAQTTNSNAAQLQASIGNANDAVNLGSVADSALSSVTENLQRMLVLAQQSSNGTVSAEQRDNISAEFSKIKAATLSIANNTTFNGIHLLNAGSDATAKITAGTAQLDLSDIALVGSNPEDGILTRSYDGVSLTSDAFDISGASSQEQRLDVVKALKSMIDGTSSARATVGSFQSEANQSISDLSNEAIGLYTQSRSSIMDVDVAQEAANLSLLAIRQQASASILSQASSMPQNILALLRG